MFKSTCVRIGMLCSLSFYAVNAKAADDIYQTIYTSVSKTSLQGLLKDMTGFNPVTVNGETFTIKNRYTPKDKANYRKYWSNYMKNLGYTVQEMAYDTQYNLESKGHNLEAILPGKSKDSVVIIVHYDSMGPHGSDNEAVDDDMTGMAVSLETARLLVNYKDRLQYTVRFVAADYEEWAPFGGQGLEGAREYAKYIEALSQRENFKLVAGIDNEQSGWKEGAERFDVFSCGGPTNSDAMGDLLEDTARKYGQYPVTRDCMGENSDHYALWEIGVPTVVYSEHDPFNNPHFDHAGGDTYARINQDYYFKIAKIGVTFAARVVGINPTADVAVAFEN